MRVAVLRVQDGEGRGPWKPGFSYTWAEERADLDNLLPWYMEFGQVHLVRREGEHFGCGCMTVAQLRRWFTPGEYAFLVAHGYRAVRLEGCRVLAESAIQCVFARWANLRHAVEFDLYPRVLARV